MLVGHFVSGRIHDFYALPEGGHDWAKIFMIPIAVTVVAGVAFILLFSGERYRADATALETVAVET